MLQYLIPGTDVEFDDRLAFGSLRVEEFSSQRTAHRLEVEPERMESIRVNTNRGSAVGVGSIRKYKGTVKGAQWQDDG